MVYHDSKATQSPLLRAFVAVSNGVVAFYGPILPFFAHMFPVCPHLPERSALTKGPSSDCQTPDAVPPVGWGWIRSPAEALKLSRPLRLLPFGLFGQTFLYLGDQGQNVFIGRAAWVQFRNAASLQQRAGKMHAISDFRFRHIGIQCF